MLRDLGGGADLGNDLTYLSSTTAPCGGWKESGVGREGGQFSMDDYTELKWLTFQSNRPW